MTPLTIIPNYDKKRLKCYGTVAAGEHVLVTVTGGTDWVAPDGENQTLRLRLLFGPHTVGVFPFVTEEMHEDDPEAFPTVDVWDVDGDDPTCDLNLNTIQAAKFLKFGGNCLFVLDDPTNDILYATGEFEVLPWPKRRGADLPYDLDGYPDFVFDAKNAMAEAAETAQNAANAASAAEATAARLEQDVYGHRQAAEAAATNAQNSASAASNSATEAKGWANGGTDGDTPTATNNAKYYAGQAGNAKTDAAASATGAAASATAAAGSATSAAGSATAAASSAQSAAGAAEAAVETEKERAEGAESDLQDAIDAEKERAEGAEALAIVNAEYNGTSKLIVFTTSGGETKTIDASAFIKDGMVSSVSVSNGNLVITFNSDAGKQPISIPLTQIFNPSNYYDKDAADGTFVKKDGAKGLSSNDYTTAEKQKLAGIAPNANAYVLPPATSSALGGVKQGTGCTIAADGTLNVTGGGGETPIAPSTAPSAQGKPADAKATGDALAGKLNRSEAGEGFTEWNVNSISPLYVFVSCSYSQNTNTWTVNLLYYPLGSTEPVDVTEAFLDGADATELVGVHISLSRTKIRPTKTSELTNDGNGVSPFATVSQIPDISGKADAADLRYRIAEAGYATTGARLPDEASIWYNGVDVTDDGTLSWNSETDTWGFGTDEGLVAWDEEGSFEGKAYEESVVLKVNGSTVNSFNLLVPRALADRTVNLITESDETSIDIELPETVMVDGVRYCRDFFLDVDNSANASDLALEFTGLGVDYAFVPLEDDSISEMMTIGAGERVRLYFTETPYTETGSLPVINVARATLGDFVTSTTTQGGN